MKDLETLRAYIKPIPALFGAEGDTAGQFPVLASSAETNLQTGFPDKYALAEGDNGADILRSDMNKFGMLASKELYFKQAGGVHTFNAEIAESIDGYPTGSVITKYDGEYLKEIRSVATRNKKDINGEYVVDGYVDTTDGGVSNEKAFYWRTCSYIHGIADGSLTFGADYSNINIIKPGEILTHDSIVVIYCFSYDQWTSSIGKANMNLDVTVTINHEDGTSDMLDIKNKGRSGLDTDYLWIVPVFNEPPYPKNLYGASNFDIQLFLRKGDSLDVTINNHINPNTDSHIEVLGFPITITTA